MACEPQLGLPAVRKVSYENIYTGGKQSIRPDAPAEDPNAAKAAPAKETKEQDQTAKGAQQRFFGVNNEVNQPTNPNPNPTLPNPNPKFPNPKFPNPKFPNPKFP